MKVALVHDWLTGMRGGERCLEVLCELFPDADIYTLLHVKHSTSPIIEKHRVYTSFIQHLPFPARWYRHYLPLFPLAIESLNLSPYDLIISSSHCVAKGVRVSDRTCHIAYTYTPMRYIWDQYDSYFADGRAGRLTRSAMRLLRPHLQRWDVATSAGVDHFVAISTHIARKIERYYGRKASVGYPPVDWHRFDASQRDDGFYLMVTAFAPYKQVDVAIATANRAKFRLKIIGSGQDERRLRRLAGPTVELLGQQPDHVVGDYYARCRALLYPGEEDFGIVPLEAMACGKPVIAFGKGGVLETVVPLNPSAPALTRDPDPHVVPTGVFFYEQTAEAMIEAIRLFERNVDRFDPQAIRRHVEPFDRAHFKERMKHLIEQRVNEVRALGVRSRP